MCRGPFSSSNGCSSAGRDPENSRSHACEPMDVTTDSCLAGSRKPIARTNPDSSGSASWTAASPPSSMVATRKMAAGVKGARTGCAKAGGTRPTLAGTGLPPAARMENMSQASANGLCEFIDASPSPYHVCATVAQWLPAAGYTELAERDRWQADGRYFTVRAGSIVAWNSAGPPGRPFRIVGGHTDSPHLRLQQHPDRFISGWRVVALQPYGGAWLNSWLDRDLGISGRLSVRNTGTITQRLISIDAPVLRVPQLAIHLAEDRKSVKLDPQRHVDAVWGVGDRARSFLAYIAERAGVDVGEVLGADLMT